MKLLGLIGVALILLSEIPFSRNEESEFSPRPYLDLDYDVMIPGQVVVGKDVFLKCTYLPANDTLRVKEYTFFFNGTILKNDTETGITIFGDSLKLAKVNKTHAGKYFCHVRTNIKGDKASENYFLEVHDSTNPETPDYQGLPIIHLGVEGSNTATVKRFDNVTLICSVEPASKNIKRITFFRDGEEMDMHHVAHNREFSSATFKIPRIAMSFSGVYYCEAFTSFGTIFSNSIRLGVMNHFYHSSGAPGSLELTANLGHEINAKEIQEYDEVYMTCDITPNYTNIRNPTWFKNKVIFPENVLNGIIYEDTKLTLKYVTKNSIGNYSCLVDTDQGLVLSNNSVHIQVNDNFTAFTIVSEEFKNLDIQTLCPDVWELLQLPHIPKARLGFGFKKIYSYYSLVENDNKYFTCDVTPITAQVQNIKWFLNGEELVPNKTVEIYEHPPTLVFPCVKKKYAGNIHCQAEIDDDTKPKSDTFKMEIEEPARDQDTRCSRDNPMLIAELLHNPKYIYINQPAVWLHCHIHPKKIPFKIYNITWLLDSQELKPLQVNNSTLPANLPDDYVTQHGRSLKIHRIKETYAGLYQCQINTDRQYRVLSAPAPLVDVQEQNKIPSRKNTVPPIVIAELQDDHHKKYENDTVFFYCDVKPKTFKQRRVRWFYNDELLDEMIHKYVTINNHSLKLNQVKVDHAGIYLCQIETAVGTFTSDPTRLEIQKGTSVSRTARDTDEMFSNPKLIDPSEANDIYEQDYVYFYCGVIPPRTTVFDVRWYHNDKQMYPDGINIINISDRIIYLHKISKNATGNYRCEADTKKGHWGSSNIYLNVKPGVRGKSKWFMLKNFRFG